MVHQAWSSFPCAWLLVLTGACAATAWGQEKPADRVRRAVAAARTSGRLQKVAGTHVLRHGLATLRLEAAVSDRGIVIDEVVDDPASNWGPHRETVGLSSEGTVTSMSSSLAGNQDECRSVVVVDAAGRIVERRDTFGADTRAWKADR